MKPAELAGTRWNSLPSDLPKLASAFPPLKGGSESGFDLAGKRLRKLASGGQPAAPSTWVLYPDPDQVPVRDPARLVARLHGQGVELSPLEDGTLAVTGPSQWFTDDSRRELRRRVVGIVTHLVVSKGGDDAAA
jgi:hypothetical protein